MSDKTKKDAVVEVPLTQERMEELIREAKAPAGPAKPVTDLEGVYDSIKDVVGEDTARQLCDAQKEQNARIAEGTVSPEPSKTIRAAGTDEDAKTFEFPKGSAPSTKTNYTGMMIRARAAAEQTGVTERQVLEQWTARDARYAGALDIVRGADGPKYDLDLSRLSPDQMSKALQTGLLDSGGGLVTQYPVDAEIIPALVENSFLRRMGASVRPFAIVNKNTLAPEATLRGEAQARRAGTMTYGQFMPTARYIGTDIPVSNQLLGRAGFSLDTDIQNQIVRAISRGIDRNALLGDGGEYAPKGIRNRIPAGNIDQAADNKTLDTVVDVLKKLMVAPLKHNVELMRPGFIMNPIEYSHLLTIRDTNGAFVFRAEVENSRLFGATVEQTNMVSHTQSDTGKETATGTKSVIYYGGMEKAVILEEDSLDIQVTREGAYTKPDGSLASAFSERVTVIGVEQTFDFFVEHDEAFALATRIDWT